MVFNNLDNRYNINIPIGIIITFKSVTWHRWHMWHVPLQFVDSVICRYVNVKQVIDKLSNQQIG